MSKHVSSPFNEEKPTCPFCGTELALGFCPCCDFDAYKAGYLSLPIDPGDFDSDIETEEDNLVSASDLPF